MMSAVAILLNVIILLRGIQCINTQRKNVLFLVSDDMRPNIEVYKSWYAPKMHTPNLDKLASRSLLLKRAYVQQAVCSPSRTSLLTGRRPETTKVTDLIHYFRIVGGNFTTIPQYFKQNGYITAGLGKVFHAGMLASGNDDPISWTEPYFHDDNSYWGRDLPSWLSVPKEEHTKHPLPDQQTANKAVDTMRHFAQKAKTGEQPFFIAVGFHRPHLPFVSPEEFFNYYPIESVKLPSNPYAPVRMPEFAWSNFDEIRGYPNIRDKYGYGAINTTFPDKVVLEHRRAYYAAVSFIDSLIGQVVDELDSLGLTNNTIISFWGDHGWQLGEHGEWCKHTNFELATHAPMMVHVPGLTDGGVVTERLTEFVDLFPTLAEAAGLKSIPLCPKDSSQVELCTEGVSMLPLVKDPTREWKKAAFSQYPRMMVQSDQIMGKTMRTDQYRYTEWIQYHGMSDYKLYWNTNRGIELYDHKVDPQENINRAGDLSYANIRKKLHQQLVDGWRDALPPGY